MAEEATIPGLNANKRNVGVNSYQPIFDKRDSLNLFIKNYYKITGM